MSSGIFCVIERPELKEVIQVFLRQFELQAEWLEDLELLQLGLELEKQSGIFNCILIDQSCGYKELLTTLKLVRYLPHTKFLDVIVFANPAQAVLPLYQAGATICIDTPLNLVDLETAFDRLFGKTDTKLSVPTIQFEDGIMLVDK